MSAWRSCSLTSVHFTLNLMKYLAAEGLDRAQALQDSGVTEEMLLDTSYKMKVLDEHIILRNIQVMLPDTPFCLDIGLSARVSTYGMLGYAFLTAPTMRHALSIAAEYPALIANNFDLSVWEYGGRGRIIFNNYSGASDLKSPYAELALASFKRTCTDILGEDLQLISVGFEGEESAKRRLQYEDAFGCSVLFGQVNNFLEFPAQCLDRALPFADIVSQDEILGMCRRQSVELAAEREWMSRVRAIISQTLHNPIQLEDVASQMHCSARTLRRQLQIYKTSYRQLLDELRFERAKALLKEGRLQTDDIAEALGFCDGAGFRRAFQRWSGQPPGAYKA